MAEHLIYKTTYQEIPEQDRPEGVFICLNTTWPHPEFVVGRVKDDCALYPERLGYFDKIGMAVLFCEAL